MWIKKNEQINQHREREIREAVERDIENKRSKINEKERKVLEREIAAQNQLNAAEAKLARSKDINCEASETKLKNEKEMRHKLKQANRLREQKKLRITYLEESGLTLNDEPLTYQSLLKLAEGHQKDQVEVK